MKLILFSFVLSLMCISLSGCMTDTMIRWWNDGIPMSEKESKAYSICMEGEMTTNEEYDLFRNCLKEKGY